MHDYFAVDAVLFVLLFASSKHLLTFIRHCIGVRMVSWESGLFAVKKCIGI